MNVLAILTILLTSVYSSLEAVCRNISNSSVKDDIKLGIDFYADIKNRELLLKQLRKAICSLYNSSKDDLKYPHEFLSSFKLDKIMNHHRNGLVAGVILDTLIRQNIIGAIGDKVYLKIDLVIEEEDWEHLLKFKPLSNEMELVYRTSGSNIKPSLKDPHEYFITNETIDHCPDIMEIDGDIPLKYNQKIWMTEKYTLDYKAPESAPGEGEEFISPAQWLESVQARKAYDNFTSQIPVYIKAQGDIPFKPVYVDDARGRKSSGKVLTDYIGMKALRGTIQPTRGAEVIPMDLSDLDV